MGSEGHLTAAQTVRRWSCWADVRPLSTGRSWGPRRGREEGKAPPPGFARPQTSPVAAVPLSSFHRERREMRAPPGEK